MGKAPRGQSEVFRELLEKGPLPTSCTRTRMSASTRRHYDIRLFNPMKPGKMEGIRYLNEYHDDEEVLRRWLSHNWDRLEASGKTVNQLTALLSPRFMDAWYKVQRDSETPVRSPDYGDAEDNVTGDHECPFCPASVSNLPRHMRSCEERPG